MVDSSTDPQLVDVSDAPAPEQRNPVLAKFCKVSGDGHRKAMAKQMTSFTIEAYDANGVLQVSGGEPFVVAVRGPAQVIARMYEKPDGKYHVRYCTSVSGEYTVSVSLHGEALAGSPFLLIVHSRDPHARNCKLRGAGLENAIAREPTSFEVEFLDAFNQLTHAKELSVYVELVDNAQSTEAPAAEAASGSEAGAATTTNGGFISNASLQAISESQAESQASPEGQPLPAQAPAAAPVEPLPSQHAHHASTCAPTVRSEAGTDVQPPYDSLKPRGLRRSELEFLEPWRADHSLQPRGAVSDRDRIHSRMTSHRRSPSRSPGRRSSAASSRGCSSERFHLDATERQQHMTLWARRLATDGVTRSKPTTIALSARSTRSETGSGPSYAQEISSDPNGVAFAYGGVDPGTLHAGGKIHKVHQVHYSIGRAGRYKLHVGLRQYAAQLPGSPFMLTVAPGPAHATWTRVECGNRLPVKAIVGEQSQGIQVVSSDRMSNRCLVGGAAVKVTCDSDSLQSTCQDNDDGTYLVSWYSQTSGTYKIRVSIGGIDVKGSPTPILMLASKPDVNQFNVRGDGLATAIAGRPAVVRIRCKDAFGNLCALSNAGIGIGTGGYGLALLSTTDGPERSNNESGAAASKKSVKGGRGAVDHGESAADRQKGAKGELQRESMDFEGTWIDEEYQISYVAQKAGKFALHLWCVPEGGTTQERLPGSPFELLVSEGNASASGSHIRGLEQLREQKDISAGSEISIQPQLRDQFGNASSASEGALVASLDTPSGEECLTLPVRRHGTGLGSYEVSYSPELRGQYSLHVKLHGEPISDSPVNFSCAPGAPNGAKSHLIVPAEPFTVAAPSEIILVAVDKYGNKLDRGGANVNARAAGNAASSCTVDDNADGTYTIKFTQNAAGDCKVVARMDNVEVAPLLVTFVNKVTIGEAAGTTAPRCACQCPCARP